MLWQSDGQPVMLWELGKITKWVPVLSSQHSSTSSLLQRVFTNLIRICVQCLMVVICWACGIKTKWQSEGGRLDYVKIWIIILLTIYHTSSKCIGIYKQSCQPTLLLLPYREYFTLVLFDHGIGSLNQWQAISLVITTGHHYVVRFISTW